MGQVISIFPRRNLFVGWILFFGGIMSLLGCGVGGSSSIVKRDSVTGRVTTETRTNSVGITTPAPVATASEAAYANAVMTQSALSQQYAAAQLEWAQRNNLPPNTWSGLYGAGVPVTGYGIGMTGVVGTYTPAGEAVAAQLRQLLSPNSLNITVIQGAPVTGAVPAPPSDNDSDSTPPAPPPPRFNPSPSPAPTAKNDRAGREAAVMNCLAGTTTADQMTSIRDRVMAMRDNPLAKADDARKLVTEADATLREIETRCRLFNPVRKEARELRTQLNDLRTKLRIIDGGTGEPDPAPPTPAAGSSTPLPPGAIPSPPPPPPPGATPPGITI